MTKRMIKDPYFEMYSKGGNVSKRLEGKGNLSEVLPLNLIDIINPK